MALFELCIDDGYAAGGMACSVSSVRIQPLPHVVVHFLVLLHHACVAWASYMCRLGLYHNLCHGDELHGLCTHVCACFTGSCLL